MEAAGGAAGVQAVLRSSDRRGAAVATRQRGVTLLAMSASMESMATSRLSFAKLVEYHVPKQRTLVVAVPVIDGRPPYARFEDRYPGVEMSVVHGTTHLKGTPLYEEGGRTVLLDGRCGVAGCCGVMAMVELSADRTVWQDFFATGRPEIPGGLRFEFDRSEYEAALDQLPDVAILG